MKSPFELGMLICFGLSWPFAIYKSIKTKKTGGKSPIFMAIVDIGYVSGILHKVLYFYDWVIWLYVANFLMVSFDLFLYCKYNRRPATLQTANAARSTNELE
jgi:hypothetical protein